MANISKRSFVKRGGAATLGTFLGLGLLPSLTRKLHATDQSGPPPVPNGVKFDYAGNGTASRSDTFQGGTLTMSITFSCSPGKGVCAPTGLFSTLRTATFSITLSGVFYTGTATDQSLITWECLEGTPMPAGVIHPTPPTTGPNVAIGNPNNPKETVGTLFTIGSRGSDPYVAYGAQVMIGDEYSPEFKLGPIQYTAACCVV